MYADHYGDHYHTNRVTHRGSAFPMDAGAASTICEVLIKSGARFWVYGGWAVDAVLGRETRSHKDLDLVVDERDLGKIITALKVLRFKENCDDDDLALHDGRLHAELIGECGRCVEIRPIRIDEDGNGTFGYGESKEVFTTNARSGRGRINGKSVPCISGRSMLETLIRWAPKHPGKYNADIRALCEKYVLEFPLK